MFRLITANRFAVFVSHVRITEFLAFGKNAVQSESRFLHCIRRS